MYILLAVTLLYKQQPCALIAARKICIEVSTLYANVKIHTEASLLKNQPSHQPYYVIWIYVDQNDKKRQHPQGHAMLIGRK